MPKIRNGTKAHFGAMPRVFKIHDILCMVLSNFDVDKGHDKWVTPLGREFQIRDMFCISLSDFVVVDRWHVDTHNSLFESCHCRWDLDNSKINHLCSTVPHSLILRSIPYCFRIVSASQ